MKSKSLFAILAAFFLGSCSMPNSQVVTTMNSKAALPGVLAKDPFEWRVITTGVNTRDHTMFTLFGNVAASNYSRTNSVALYPEGTALALATWTQKEDGRWFGAKIPSQVKSVELLEMTTTERGSLPYHYRVFEGSPLVEANKPIARVEARAAYIRSMRAAVMP